MLTGLNGQMVYPQEQKQPDEILSMLNEQYESEAKQLDASVKSLESNLTRDTQYKLKAAENEYNIKLNSFYNKHGISLAEVRSKRIQHKGRKPEDIEKINAGINDLNTQYTLTMERIKSKIQPDLDDLQTKKQMSVQQLQQEFAQKKAKIQHIRELVAKGVIQNPAAALQEQYQTLGISMSQSSFQTRGQTARQELSDIDSQLRAIESETKIDWFSPDAAKKTDPELLRIQQDLKNRKLELIKQLNPAQGQALQRGNKLTRATTTALVGDGQYGGTLAGRVKVAKQNSIVGKTPQQTSARETLQQLKSQGMSKEEAINWMRANGY